MEPQVKSSQPDPIKAMKTYDYPITLKESNGTMHIGWEIGCPALPVDTMVCLYQGLPPSSPTPGVISSPVRDTKGDFNTNKNSGSNWSAALVAKDPHGHLVYLVKTGVTD